MTIRITQGERLILINQYEEKLKESNKSNHKYYEKLIEILTYKYEYLYDSLNGIMAEEETFNILTLEECRNIDNILVMHCCMHLKFEGFDGHAHDGKLGYVRHRATYGFEDLTTVVGYDSHGPYPDYNAMLEYFNSFDDYKDCNIDELVKIGNSNKIFKRL